MASFLRLAIIFLSIILGIPVILSAQPAETLKSDPRCPGLQEEQAKYLANHQYNELVDFLNSSKQDDQGAALCRDYYKANARLLQLKYLEENQSWDEYFANGNTYREELVDNAQKVIERALPADNLKVKSRLLLWQFHQGQQDAFTEAALEDLVADLKAYAQQDADLDLIKEAADQLLANQERSKAREIYKLYVAGLTAQAMTAEQLKNVAGGFYQQGNLELAQSIYDLYLDEIAKTWTVEKMVPELFEIAGLFVYKASGFYDMAYAEKVYAAIEALGQKEVFNQDTIYLRAFNLEKMNAYQDAKKYYLELTRDYPDTQHFDEATYKAGLISAYALGDVDEARKYFEILSSKTTASPQVISSLYQLGLLAQWQGDLVKADSYYQLLLKNAADQYAATVAKTQERLKEIQENKPISYNLKTFLDLALKNEPALVEMNKSQLNSTGYILEKNQNATISSSVNMPQSGCNQVELQYLWSGDLGGANPGVTESNFAGAYPDRGTKDINIVIISPAGAIDRSFTMVDVY